MATVYLTEHGSTAHKIDERLVVRKFGKVLADIPLIKVDAVRVIGRGISVTTPLLTYLMEQGIDTTFLNGGQRFLGRLTGAQPTQGALRVQQARALDDEGRCLELAKASVRGKLINQRFMLRKRAGTDEAIRQAMDRIEAMRDRIAAASSLEVLRGLEGQAAASYFAGFRRLLRQPLGFERRVQHPPTDPVNSMLSFGYTLLLNDLMSAIQIVGLDPYIGYFHTLSPGRPSLALDLEEEFRPVIVDTLVLSLVNHSTLVASDFRRGSEDGGSVLLGTEARRRYLQAYAERLDTRVIEPATNERVTYRRVLELQTRSLARAISGERPYVAFASQ